MIPDLKSWLATNKINYIPHSHKAVFTVPEAEIHCGHISGTHCKNLFVKNKKNGEYFLITLPSDKRLDLKQFRKIVHAPKIRFAPAEELMSILGVIPGAVTPLGLINDVKKQTTFYVDEAIWKAAEICCHPNINTETLQIPQESFHRLIDATGNKKVIMAMPYLEEESE